MKNKTNIIFDKPFRLFDTCKITKGVKRSIIADLLRKEYHCIPNDLSNIIKKYEGKTINDILLRCDSENRKTVIEYFNFLIKKEFIFFSDCLEAFKCSEKEYSHKSEIYQGILDFNKLYLPKHVFEDLSYLGCKFLDIRIFKPVEYDALVKFLRQFDSSTVVNISLYIPYKSEVASRKLIRLSIQFPRLQNVFITGAPSNKKLAAIGDQCLSNIFHIMQPLSSSKSCGNISPMYFSLTMQMHTEGMRFNSCLYKKISVDVDGNIKNCPSMRESFGNVKSTRILDVIELPAFKNIWRITKASVSVCQECEFRNVCPDCRAYLETPSDLYSKPLKCGYDPYRMKWEKWTDNPLKKSAIEYYNTRTIL